MEEKKTQIYEKTEEIFGNPLMGYAPCAWEETIGRGYIFTVYGYYLG